MHVSTQGPTVEGTCRLAEVPYKSLLLIRAQKPGEQELGGLGTGTTPPLILSSGARYVTNQEEI